MNKNKLIFIKDPNGNLQAMTLEEYAMYKSSKSNTISKIPINYPKKKCSSCKR